MKRIIVWILASISIAAQAQSPDRAGRMLLVLPFENKSKATGLEWIGESFPEVLNQRMQNPALFIISREDRLFAFDRMGVPADANPSRATVYTVAQAMDVDYVVLGSYNYDGRTFTSISQVLDMRNLKLSPAVTESGSLTDLIQVQTATAYDLLAQIDLPRSTSPEKQQFLASMPQVRLDALENYVRGAIATDSAEKIRRFREAVRISPDYTFAKLQLARTYFGERDYEQAANWFARVPRTASQALEASFFYGLCEFYLGDMQKAQDAFQYVASRLPLTEVENNLGAVIARRGKPALEYFRRAVQTDARDPDYRFNLAVALMQSGDTAEAARQLREVLSDSPDDAEAHALLDTLQRPSAQSASLGTNPSAAQPKRVFLPRVKSEFNEAAFRQAEMEMRNLEELTFEAKAPQQHAQAHVDRGTQMLANGFYDEAEFEFREALKISPRLVAAHVGLARTLLRKNDVAGAKAEAEQALAIEPANVEAVKLSRELPLAQPKQVR